MRILIAVATYNEINPFLKEFSDKENEKLYNISSEEKSIDILISEISMISTAFELGRILATNKYDLAINVGVAGSFNREIKLGEVVNVVKDVCSELGVDEVSGFKKLKNYDFIDKDDILINENLKSNSNKIPVLSDLRKVKAITVNTISGSDDNIKIIEARENVDIETMEGAAFMYACNKSNVDCVQIRSISNYVETRNKQNWNMKLAINNLNSFLKKLIESL